MGLVQFAFCALGSWLLILYLLYLLRLLFGPPELTKDQRDALVFWSVALTLAFGLWVAHPSPHVPLSYHAPHVPLRYHYDCGAESEDDDDHPEYDDPGFGLHP